MAIPISNVTRRVVYSPSGAGGAGPYAFTFEILANTDIAVYKDDVLLTLTTHYTVSIASNGTGSVTITATGLALAPVSPTQYAIVGNRTISRSTDFTTGGDFFANTLNDELDQQTIFAQQNAEGVARALSAPQTDPTSINMTLPRSTARAGKVLTFDSIGNPTAEQVIGSNRGNWASGTSYFLRDLAKDTTTNNVFQVITAHTSSGSLPITTNADSAKWTLLVDAASATTSATNAAASASAAATSASNASTSATSATASASTASTQASNAATSASNASTSATAAAASAASAAASFDAFDDIYLGAKASDPTLDNDGNALTTGDQYFNTTANELRVYNGSTWQAASTVGGTVTSLSVTGVASFADGSAAAPSITNSGDTDTGIYYPAANQVAISTNGTQAILVNANQNVTFTNALPVASGGTGLTTVPHTVQVFTSGSGTYTTPANVKAIWVRMVGGGGGAGGTGTGSPTAGGNGGNTTFGSSFLTCNGGTGSSPTSGSPALAGGSATGGDINITGGGGTAYNGTATGGSGAPGGNSAFGGSGAGGGPNGAGLDAATNSGSGGGGAGSSGASVSSTAGSAAGYLEKLIAAPSATYSYAVGAGGTAGAAGTNGFVGGAGGSGVIIVTEYYV